LAVTISALEVIAEGAAALWLREADRARERRLRAGSS